MIKKKYRLLWVDTVRDKEILKHRLRFLKFVKRMGDKNTGENKLEDVLK